MTRVSYAALLVAAALAGCAGTDEQGRPVEPPTPAPVADQRSYLYGLPEMRQAAVHRQRANVFLERAYTVKDAENKLIAFDDADAEYQIARDAYYRAMSVAPRRYHPVIEREIDAIQGFILRIQQDRPIFAAEVKRRRR